MPGLAAAANEASGHWDALVAPELARLDHEVAQAEVTVDQLTAAAERYRAASGEPIRRFLAAHRSTGELAREMEVYRNQLDGLGRPAPRPAVGRDASVRPRPAPASGPVPEPDTRPSL
jgi:hypothetical protein